MSFVGAFGGTRKLRNDEEREGVVLADVMSAGAWRGSGAASASAQVHAQCSRAHRARRLGLWPL
jgi:hypothetical protein